MSIVLQNCIEQPFDTQVVGVARNGDFAEEFLYNIRLIFQSLDTRMSMYINNAPLTFLQHITCT